MNLIRKYKISKLIGKPLDSKDAALMAFIESWFTDISLVTDVAYPNNIFIKTKRYNEYRWLGVYLYNTSDIHNLNPFYPVVLITHIDFWRVLEKEYSLSVKDIDTIMRYFIQPLFKQTIYEFQISYTEDSFPNITNEYSSQI